MHHPEADELGVLESRDQRQDACLLAPFQLRLETHQAEVIAGDVVLTQLHHGVRRAPGSRIDESDRLHRSEAERVATAMRHHLDRQTTFEELLFVEIVHRGRFRRDERVIEPRVLLFGHRTIQIVPFAIIDTARWTVRRFRRV